MDELVVFCVSGESLDKTVEYLTNKKVPVVYHKQHNFIHVDKCNITDDILEGALSINSMFSVCQIGDTLYKWHKGKVRKFIMEEE